MSASCRGRTQNTRSLQGNAPQVSAETQQLLKLMMAESKLTNFQRRQLNSRLQDGRPLPVTCNPTSSRKPNNAPKKTPTKKVMDGKCLSAAGKRTKDVIDLIVDKDSETYKPLPGKAITDKDKRKLQNQMAFGEDLPDIETSRMRNNRVESVDDHIEEIDDFDEVLNQIDERKEFLKDMENLGQGNNYRTIIQTEISQKIRELEIIDKQRTSELEKLLETKKGESS